LQTGFEDSIPNVKALCKRKPVFKQGRWGKNENAESWRRTKLFDLQGGRRTGRRRFLNLRIRGKKWGRSLGAVRTERLRGESCLKKKEGKKDGRGIREPRQGRGVLVQGRDWSEMRGDGGARCGGGEFDTQPWERGVSAGRETRSNHQYAYPSASLELQGLESRGRESRQSTDRRENAGPQEKGSTSGGEARGSRIKRAFPSIRGTRSPGW